MHRVRAYTGVYILWLAVIMMSWIVEITASTEFTVRRAGVISPCRVLAAKSLQIELNIL